MTSENIDWLEYIPNHNELGEHLAVLTPTEQVSPPPPGSDLPASHVATVPSTPNTDSKLVLKRTESDGSAVEIHLKGTLTAGGAAVAGAFMGSSRARGDGQPAPDSAAIDSVEHFHHVVVARRPDSASAHHRAWQDRLPQNTGAARPKFAERRQRSIVRRLFSVVLGVILVSGTTVGVYTKTTGSTDPISEIRNYIGDGINMVRSL